MALTREQAESIIEAGILAPSADNRHLLRFEIAEGGIRLWGSDEFEAAPFHRRVLSLISLGAVVENMVLRGARLGLRAEVTWREPGAASTAPLAAFRLSNVEPHASGLEAAIPARQTNRRVVFRGPALPAAEQRRMDEHVRGVGGVRLLWLDTPALRHQALRLVTLAESERFRSQPLHEDLFGSIRFDVGWRRTATEGLPPGALEIEPPMRPLFKGLRHWGWMRLLAAVGVHRIIGMRAAYVPCRTAPHVCALVTGLDLEPGALAAGRALERVWLRATQLGLAFQPLAASALLALEGYRDVDVAIRDRLADTWRGIGRGALPLMVFRMGFAAPASIQAGRPPISDLFSAERESVDVR